MTKGMYRCCVMIACLLVFQTIQASDYRHLGSLGERNIQGMLTHEDRSIGGSRDIFLIARCLYGPAQCVTVHGDLSYTGAGSALLIHDIHNPSAPQFLGSVYTPGVLNGVCFRDDIVYAADGPAGIAAIDVAAPMSPTVRSVLDVEGWIEELDIMGNCAYLAAGYGGMKVIDISDPQNLIQIGALSLESYSRDIKVVGKYAYICGGVGRRHFWIVDISSPSSPEVIYHYYDTYGTGLSFTGAFVLDSFLYLSGYGGQVDRSFVHIFDVSDPSSPQEMSHLYFIPPYASDIVIANVGTITYAFTVNTDYGIAIIDVTDPNKPYKVTDFVQPSFDWVTWMCKLFVKEQFLYAVGDWLWIIDVSAPAIPALTGYYDTGNHATNIHGPHRLISPADDICAIANWGNGLQLIDVSNPSTPLVRGSILWPGYYCRDVHLSPRYRYAYTVLYGGYLKICDMRNPNSPCEIGSLLPPSAPLRLFQLADYVYASCVGYFRAIDVSDPYNPWEAGQYAYGQPVIGYEVFALGQLAYSLARPISTETGLFVFDVADPSTPTVLGTCAEISGYDLFVENGFAYIADQGAYSPGPPGGLAVVNVSDPEEPKLVAYADLGCDAFGCFVDDDFAFIADKCGLNILDISDPEDPILIDSYDLPEIAYDVHYARGCVYVTAGRCGLYIFRFYPPDDDEYAGIIKGSTIQENIDSHTGNLDFEFVIPNPVKDEVNIKFEASVECRTATKMYDVSGRLVGDILHGRTAIGLNEVRLRTDNLASGVYFLRLKVGEQSRVFKVRIVK